MSVSPPFASGALAMAVAIAVGACRPADDGMASNPPRKTFLDPYTALIQTDDDREGRSLVSEPGAAMPNSRALMSRFKELSGATVCRDLKGIGTGKVLCSCEDCVRNAIRAVGEKEEA